MEKKEARLPSWMAAFALNGQLPAISVAVAIMPITVVSVVRIPVVVVVTVVVSRTIMPGAGNPNPARREI